MGLLLKGNFYICCDEVMLRVAIKRGLCHSSYIFNHHHHHLIVIIIACNPAWDIDRQSAPSSHHGPAGPDVLTLPMCSQSSLSLPPDHSPGQVFLGLPLFLFFWGFQEMACLVTLDAGLRRMWPIHLQRLWRMSSLPRFLVAVVCQRILKIHMHAYCARLSICN